MIDIAKIIGKELNEYSNEVREVLNESGRKASKESLKVAKANAPKRSGNYAKSLKVKKELGLMGNVKYIVHSKDHYRLTHLLEHGHATTNGGRVEGTPHLSIAEKVGVELFEKEIKGKLE